MDQIYNRKKHQQLLDSKRLEGKSAIELSNYRVMVYCQLIWGTRNEFLEIFKDFLENKITRGDFCELIDTKLTLAQDFANENVLENDIFDKVSEDFTSLVDDVIISCDICDPTPEPYRLPHHIGETEFRQEIQELFLMLQKLVEE